MNQLPADSADLGEVTTQPLHNATPEMLHGPWLMMCESLQGELFFERNGFVNFRPGSGLGHGVGRVELISTSLGMSTFTLDLEVYAYQNIAHNPPLSPQRFTVAGYISTVNASKNQYQTLTLNGTLSSTAHSNNQNFNAAKLTPWDPSQAKPWAPDAEVRDALKQFLPPIPTLTSHKHRTHVIETQPGGPKHIDLSYYRVGSIPHVYYIPNYVSQEEQQAMLLQLQATPDQLKTKMKKRVVQEWGCVMCDECKQSFVPDANLPPWTEQVNEMLLYDGVFTPTTFPNNVRIHEYEVGDGIAPHCDGPIYVPRVAIVSLQSSCVMSFYPRREPYDQPMEHYNDTFRFDGEIAKQTPLMSLVLEPGSLLVFEADAYTHHPHGISDREVDSLDPLVSGEVVNRKFLQNPEITEVVRQLRVGVTVRNLLPRCNHQPGRTEYQMQRSWALWNQKQDVGAPHLLLPDTISKPTSQTLAPHQTAAPPKLAPSNHPNISSNTASLEAKVDALLKNQEALSQTVQDLQLLITSSLQKQQSFQTETSTVLNHLSSTILTLESNVDEIVEKINNEHS
jgi:alkylated DNA repair protein alkB family protein 6